MQIKKQKITKAFFLILICSFLIFPKINIISIPGSRTGIRLEDICILIYCIYFYYRHIIKGIKINSKLKKIINSFGICFIVFLISTILGIVRGNTHFFLSFLHLFRYLEYFILFFAGYDYIKISKNKNDIFLILDLILIFHGIYMFLECLNIVEDIGYLINRPGSDRIYTTFSGPYEFSAYLTLLLPLYLYKTLKEKKWLNVLYILIIFVGVLLSQSRISLLACLTVLALMYLFLYKSPNKKKITITGIILVTICGIMLLNTSIVTRFKLIDINSSITTFKLAWENTDYDYYKETGNINYSDEVLSSTKDMSYALRVSKWATLLKEAVKTPLFGLGPSIVGEAIDGNYVRLLVETGIIGLISWISLIIIILKEAVKFKENKLSYLIFYGTISLSIIAIFIDIFVSSKIIMLLWFLIGIMYAHSEKNVKKEKIKIVHFVSGVNFGGVEAVLYNYFNNIKHKDKYENIIVSHDKINKDNQKMFEELGFKFYEVTPKRENIFKNIIQINKIIRKEQPNIVHVHMTLSSYMALFIAYINGVNVRICHSHLSLNELSIKDKIEKRLCNYYANAYFACSEDAAKYLYNNQNYKKCCILNNAIDLKKFDYNEEVRKSLRNNLDVNSKLLIGHIGRFTEQKNHKKIINIFEKALELNEDVRLLLIGDGPLKEEIQNIITERNLNNYVILLSGISDIEKYYQAMDAFLFPSLFEGLGIVAVEAQVSGLPCIVSNTVPKDVKQTNLVEFIELDEKDETWAKTILKKINEKRESKINELKNTQFDIKSEADKLDKIYLKLTKDE